MQAVHSLESKQQMFSRALWLYNEGLLLNYVHSQSCSNALHPFCPTGMPFLPSCSSNSVTYSILYRQWCVVFQQLISFDLLYLCDCVKVSIYTVLCLLVLQKVLCQLVTEEDAEAEPLIRHLGVAPKDYHLKVLRKVLIPNYCLH